MRSHRTRPFFFIASRDGQKVQHFKVLQDEMGKYFVWLRKFDSINQLIDYHRRTSISRDSFLLLVDRQPSRVSFDRRLPSLVTASSENGC